MLRLNAQLISFIDLEVSPRTHKVLDIGCLNDNKILHSNSFSDCLDFLNGSDFVCGHNIFEHDLKYLKDVFIEAKLKESNVIDTLYLSPLLFPSRPYHSLVKDYKLQRNDEEDNNPLNDCKITKNLLEDEINTFDGLDKNLQEIFYSLLFDKKEFQAFFKYIDYSNSKIDLGKSIYEFFSGNICENVDIENIILEYPIELAYALSLINATEKYSILPPWILKRYPFVEKVFFLLRSNPCVDRCKYCYSNLDAHVGLKRFFGFDSFRNYDDEPLQENAVNSALKNQSLVAVFPTGGGKSLTFQLPALMQGENTKGLTVVISPLQSLMKDQVDNLEERGIVESATINGQLDPIERAKVIQRVKDGDISILYISPEGLRSKTIEKLLIDRHIIRFVIDEAHCFSSWGQDFRPDYLYIAKFIKSLQEKKNLKYKIPISCFTATAKLKVIHDILDYFKKILDIDLKVFKSKDSRRKNLKYTIIESEWNNEKEEKYKKLRELLEGKDCPTVIYVSRTKKAKDLAERLQKDGFSAASYHGKMDKDEKKKNQEDFKIGSIQIMVATSAFGMGVDKSNIGMVIHHDISDSLENYVQESGRGGRNENIEADCYVLFNEKDLDKHFNLLNQNKLTINEIKQIWKALKNLTKVRSSISKSALEIAEEAGWHENVKDLETRVKTSISTLEELGYIERKQNSPRVFADSLLYKNAQSAIEKVNNSHNFNEKQKQNAIRIIQKLFTHKNTNLQDSDGNVETRIDYIANILGLDIHDVIEVVNRLKEEKILGDTKDLKAFIKLKDVRVFFDIEDYLLSIFSQEERHFNLKEINEEFEKKGYKNITVKKIKTILNFLSIQKWIYKKYDNQNGLLVRMEFSYKELKERFDLRKEIIDFILRYLENQNKIIQNKPYVNFSLYELKKAFQEEMRLFKNDISFEDIEDSLFYLSKIESLDIEGDFLVIYNKLNIERKEELNKQYTKKEYKILEDFYENKTEQIHIVGEYAKKMIHHHEEALIFVDDYFQLNYEDFLNKYFQSSDAKKKLKRRITQKKFEELFGNLSEQQLSIINDKSDKIGVLAGPGSGKTRILVHKLASLSLLEDVKSEQLLMLTFSRSAVNEFKKRLIKLIGNAAHYIEIKTFHSYCFDILGRVGSLEKSDSIIDETIQKIQNGEIDESRITKTAIVIDEAQDIDQKEFEFIETLISKNENIRVIMVGDDDQNIYEFRGSSSKYLERFLESENAMKHEMVVNFRSTKNLIEFSNNFVNKINNRLKKYPIQSHGNENGILELIQYENNNLIYPFVEDVLSKKLEGTTCILTTKNEEAESITNLLLEKKINAKLIQSNDGFRILDMVEMRYFFDQLSSDKITEDEWKSATEKLDNQFKNSSKFDICKKIIEAFQETNNTRYKSDFEIFLSESKIEDFINEDRNCIFVSTIHKAKGKEFDNIFLLIESFKIEREQNKRTLYVGLTRAKRNLIIHTNENYFNNIEIDSLNKKIVDSMYYPLQGTSFFLNHRDVYLGYFNYVQNNIQNIKNGDVLVVTEEGCRDIKGNILLKFSKEFIKKLKKQQEKGYTIKNGKVNFVLYWKGEEMEKEIQIILPQIYLEKK